MTSRQRTTMDCGRATRTLLLGDESLMAAARRHQAHCPVCSLAADDRPFEQLSDIVAVPPPVPLLTGALVLLAALQLALTIPWLVGIDPLGLLGPGASASHLARDGAFGVTIAAAAIIAARHRQWSRPAFLLASIALIAQTAAGLLDESIAATGSNELVHLLAICLTVLTGANAVRLAALGPVRPTPLQVAPRPADRPPG